MAVKVSRVIIKCRWYGPLIRRGEKGGPMKPRPVDDDSI